MKFVKRILLILVTSILGLMFVFNLYNIICLNILKQDLTSVLGYGILEVASGSMEPTIHTGDIIIINTNENYFDIDDIITFYDKEGSFVTHRIISKDEDGNFITKGDMNNTDDGIVRPNQVVGKCIYRLGSAGNLIKTLKSPLVMVMIFIVGVLICIYISMDKEGNFIDSEINELPKEALPELKEEKLEVIDDKHVEIKEVVIEKITKEQPKKVPVKKQKTVSKSTGKVVSKQTKKKLSNKNNINNKNNNTNNKKKNANAKRKVQTYKVANPNKKKTTSQKHKKKKRKK